MKTSSIEIAAALVLICSVAQILAADPPAAPRLTGIVNLPNFKRAVLEQGGKFPPFPENVMAEGQAYDYVQVLEIHPQQGEVKLKLKGIDGPSAVSLPKTNEPASTLVLQEASVNSIMLLYSQLTERTLLRSPNLPNSSVSISASPGSLAEAAGIVEKALAEKGIVILPDGEKFRLVVPQGEETKTLALAAEVKSRKAKFAADTSAAANTNAASRFAPGQLYFGAAELSQVFAFYTHLVGGKFNPGGQPASRGTPIYFRTQTAISKEECAYALEMLLAWQGFEPFQTDDGYLIMRRRQTL